MKARRLRRYMRSVTGSWRGEEPFWSSLIPVVWMLVLSLAVARLPSQSPRQLMNRPPPRLLPLVGGAAGLKAFWCMSVRMSASRLSAVVGMTAPGAGAPDAACVGVGAKV